MKAVAVLGLTSLLCLCFQNSLAQKRVCRHAGRWSYMKPFFTTGNAIYVNVPCRYKMANIKCGGDPAVIYGDNSMDGGGFAPVAYMTGVVVNITTTNDDGSTTYQFLSINNETLKQYMDEGDFGKSPWTWRYDGSEVDESKKLVGHYDQSSKVAVLVNGELTITFRYIAPRSFRLMMFPTLLIVCRGPEFTALESYPQTICGGPNNTIGDFDDVEAQIPSDLHHYYVHFRDDYIVLSNQNVQQPNPLCQEAASIVSSGTCSKLGDTLYECFQVFGDINHGYANCVRESVYPSGGMDRFKVYVACLRVLCGTEDASSEETCQILQKVYDVCGDQDHLPMSAFLARTNCTTNVPTTTTTTATPTTTKAKPNLWGKYSWSCTAVYKIHSWGHRNKIVPGDVDGFGVNIRLTLPCRYKMADIRCGGSHTEIETDQFLDVDGNFYIRAVVVTIGTTSKDGTLIQQTNKLTLKSLTEYIKNGNFEKRLWRWSYPGSKTPKQKDRIHGHYNQTTKSGDITYRGLSVKYFYIDPHSSNRSVGYSLKIQCDSKDFQSYGHFPDSVCGALSDADKEFWLIMKKDMPMDYHHSAQLEYILLAKQNLKQKNRMCKEIVEIQRGDCSGLGDIMSICRDMNKFSMDGRYYVECLKENNIDSIRAYIACLRVKCGTKRAQWKDTCQILRQVADTCGHVDDHWMHIKIKNLLSEANCNSSG